VLVFLLVLFLIAAAVGVLGVVIKVTLVIVLSLVLAVVALAYLGTWYVRHRVRGFQRDLASRMDAARRRRGAYDVTSEDRPRGSLGDGS
jgi:membrane protein implicated in regulation of membrane protease activity